MQLWEKVTDMKYKSGSGNRKTFQGTEHPPEISLIHHREIKSMSQV